MKTINLTAAPRSESGTKSAKELRKQDLVPCVIYGGEKTAMFSIHKNELSPIIYTGEFFKINVDIEGETFETIVKDMQFHPVTDEVLHVDFQQLIQGRKVKTSIPVILEGTAAGVREGGILQHKLLRLNVRVKPENMIESLTINVTNLNLGESLKVSDIETGAIEVLDSMSIPVASVISPRALRSAQTLAAAAAAGDDDDEGDEAEGGDEAEA